MTTLPTEGATETIPTATLVIEGQQHEVPVALVTDGATVEEQDRNLREVLRPNFELAANATFHRVEKDGHLTITVLKAPLKKGGGQRAYDRIVQRLLAAPGEITQVMRLDCELRIMEAREELDLAALLALQPRLNRVLKLAQHNRERMTVARRVLIDAAPVSSTTVPVGF